MFNSNHGKTIAQMVLKVEQQSYPQPAGPAQLDPVESMRNYNIAANMRTKSFLGNKLTSVFLPHQNEHANESRTKEYFRQAAEPWGNTFMATPTDAQRLNNNQQASFVKQRQLTIPSTYGQFYAFMHAMAAAFGNLNSSGQ